MVDAIGEPPEQRRVDGERRDRQSDRFAVGVVLAGERGKERQDADSDQRQVAPEGEVAWLVEDEPPAPAGKVERDVARAIEFGQCRRHRCSCLVLSDAADHPQHRGALLGAGVGRSGRDRFDSAAVEHERGDQASGVRSGDSHGRALLALRGDDGGGRAGDVDSATLVERLGGCLDLIEQLVGVAAERPGAHA